MTAEQFREELLTVFARAQAQSLPAVEVEARSLHGSVGNYPGPDHRMPTCCDVMRQAMQPGDEVLAEPPKGRGASLKIRYRLPRQ